MKLILRVVLCCIYFFTLLHADENIEIIDCDADTVASILQEKRGVDDYIVSIRCSDPSEFEASQYITHAKIVDVIADGDQRFIQLLSAPNAQGKQQRLNILHSDNYAIDGQLQGSGAGDYFVAGDKLYVYLYWGSGCKFDLPYEVEKITYEWDSKHQQYIQKDNVYYTTKEKESRGWECCDQRLLNATDKLTEEEQALFNQLTARDNSKKARLLWGEEARVLLVEIQQKLTKQIKNISLWRQEFCCGYEDNAYLCREQVTESQED